jgi:hypothetical protein
MSLNHGSRIVTDGLQLCLDAANTRSYSGSGTTWSDLSGNAYNASIVGSVSHTTENLGCFNMNGSQTSDYITLPVSALNNLSDGTYWSLEFWIRLDATPSSAAPTYFNSMATTSDNNYYIARQADSKITPFNESKNSGSDISYSAGEKLLLTIVHKGSSQDYYKNGVLSGNYTAANNLTSTEGWVLNQEQDSVLGGFAASQAADMGCYSIRLYNKSLSSSEVKQNYNALRGRFGL